LRCVACIMRAQDIKYSKQAYIIFLFWQSVCSPESGIYVRIQWQKTLDGEIK
jgi:hypothetical protein